MKIHVYSVMQCSENLFFSLFEYQYNQALNMTKKTVRKGLKTSFFNIVSSNHSFTDVVHTELKHVNIVTVIPPPALHFGQSTRS